MKIPDKLKQTELRNFGLNLSPLCWGEGDRGVLFSAEQHEQSAPPRIQFTLLTALLRVQHTNILPSNTLSIIPASAAVQESRDMAKYGWGKGWAAGLEAWAELCLAVGESHIEEPRNLGSSLSHLLRSSSSLAWSSQPVPERKCPRESPSPWHEIHDGMKQSQAIHTAACAPP